MTILYSSLLLFVIVNCSGRPVRVRQGTQQLFVSEVIRVRRQAGYVYNKPSVSFDLPARAPSLTVTTQAPTVDRTQAQMMYYAYPAPATGSKAVNIGASSASTVGIGAGSTATALAGFSGGYNYGTQSASSAKAQSGPTGSSQTGSVQSSSAGYGYDAPSVGNAPVSTGSIQQSNKAQSGYGYNAPSAGVAQVSTSVESNAGSSQTGSIAGSGYEYITPTNTQGSGIALEVSTNAPKYLPPTSGGGRSNNILSGSVPTGGETSGTISGSSAIVTQPLDQYLPPLISKPVPPAAPVVDQYLPPDRQPDSPGPLDSSTPSGPSSNYIPPNNLDQSPLPVTNVTPRPFSSASLSDGYLPPPANSQATVSNLLSTPASPYLPPAL